MPTSPPVAEFRQHLGEDLVQARRDQDSAAKQLEKAARRNEVTVLEAPTDAIVLDVARGLDESIREP